MDIQNIRTITELSQVEGRVYVHLGSVEDAKRFAQQAEAEGFSFGDGANPSSRDMCEVMAVNNNHTLNYVGICGMIAYGSGTTTIGKDKIIRFEYTNGSIRPYVHQKNVEKWSRLYDADGALVYEGFTKAGKPYGSGTSYYQNGNKYQEGVFGIKGLLVGKEFFPNGQTRFEGVYHLNRAYGPNYPSAGIVYSEDGKKQYEGKLTFHVGGVGYPIYARETEYGKIPQPLHPECPVFMWEDERRCNEEVFKT